MTKLAQMNGEKQIIEKKQYGDINLVAQILTKKTGRYISTNYVTQILKRPKTKLYPDAVQALKQVINSREQLISEN